MDLGRQSTGILYVFDDMSNIEFSRRQTVTWLLRAMTWNTTNGGCECITWHHCKDEVFKHSHTWNGEASWIVLLTSDTCDNTPVQLWYQVPLDLWHVYCWQHCIEGVGCKRKTGDPREIIAIKLFWKECNRSCMCLLSVAFPWIYRNLTLSPVIGCSEMFQKRRKMFRNAQM